MTRLNIMCKPKFCRLIGVFTMIIMASGCQTMALFEFESLKAPKIIIPPDVKTIGFVDRNINFDSDSIYNYYKLNVFNMKDTNNYDTIKSYNGYLGFKENISEYYNQDSVAFLRLKKKHFTGGRKFPALNWSRVDSICKASKSDILVSLEDIQISNEYTTYNGEQYMGVTDISFYAVWRTYDPMLKKIYDERVVMDSLYTEVSSYSYSKLIEEKLPTRKEINAEVSYEIGSRYAKLISPEWQTINRRYFIAGHQDFILAEYYLNNDQLDNAISLWKKYVDSEKLKLSARACYNLALANELKENFQEAKQWINKSIKTYQKMKNTPVEFKFAKEYSKDLTLRIQNNYLLDKFFGKETAQ